MRRPQGYAVTVEPGVATVEEDTITCAHCNAIVFVKPFQDPSDMGGFCQMCYRHICAACADARDCIPFEKQLDAMERRDRLLRAAGA